MPDATAWWQSRFSLSIAMPDQVSDNFRPAAIALYAVAADGTEATGANRNFYVYGYDDTADLDLTPPVIEYAYLNHQSFADGDAVNPSPMFIARVTDDTGINLSAAGVGRRMSLTLDGKTSLPDVAQYFTPSADGTPAARWLILCPTSPTAITTSHSASTTPQATRPAPPSTLLWPRGWNLNF